MSKRELTQALVDYRKAQSREVKHLNKLSARAEESGDYYDYDQACYDHWESMTDQANILAAVIAAHLNKEV